MSAEQAAEIETAGQATHGFAGFRRRCLQRLVDRDHDQVAQQLGIGWVNYGGVDLDRVDPSTAGNHHLDGSTAGAPLKGAVRQFFLGRQHLLLHLLRLTKQLAHVGRWVHGGSGE